MSRNLNHHLQRHGKGWRVRLEIPEALRPHFKGKRFLIHKLGPVSLPQARILRGPILTGFELAITQARNPDDPVIQRARMIRRDWEAATDEEAAEVFIDAVRLGDEVETTDGEEAGTNIFHIATGIATPLKDYLEEWLADAGFPEKTCLQHKKAFTVLLEWMQRRGLTPTLQAVTRKVVWEFIERHLKISVAATNTMNRYLSAYRTHWRWLNRRQRVQVNPWLDTHISEQRRGQVQGAGDHSGDEDNRKRAFTDDQVRMLLAGNAPGALPDLMLIAALTGARIDAVASLRVSDCKDGCFRFKKQKKEARGRTIPIHTNLRAVVARRVEGKAASDHLFHELPDATGTRPRSAAASQAFTRYRRKVGVGAGKGEQSEYDFHSFRRWFTTKAEQAGQPPWIIDYVTGHKRPGETLGRYSEGPSLVQMRKCVEAVKLPK